MIRFFLKFYKAIMFLTPEVLLSSTAREQCVNKLKDLPTVSDNDKQKRKAAVLVPLCVVDGEVCLLFTLRSSNLPTHSGQVSFPGGKMEKGENVFETALRETEEEIGYPPHDIDVWAKMCQLRGKEMKLLITPVIGELKNFNMSKLRPNASEVAEIFTVPMKELCDKENHAALNYNGIFVPVFECGKYKVWGITGLITHMFLQCFLPKDIYQADFMRKTYELDELLPSKL